MRDHRELFHVVLGAGLLAMAACTGTPAPGTATGAASSGGLAGAASSSSSGGGSSSGTTGGTTTGPQPLSVVGSIPGESFVPMSAISAETPDAGGHALEVVISDLEGACAILGSDAGMASRTLSVAVGVEFADGTIGPPAATGTFTVVSVFSSSGPAPGPLASIVYEDQLDGGCGAWLCTGGSVQLTSLSPVEGTFNVTLVQAEGDDPMQAQLTGSFTATACPSFDFSLLTCSD